MDRVANLLERLVSGFGRIAAWSGLLLVLVTIFDVTTREFVRSSWQFLRDFSAWQQSTFGSTRLQELEWHLHTVLFVFCIGWAYVKGAHVRIDVFRERMSVRARAWIEIGGIVLLLLPFCALVTFYAVDFAATSYAQNEASASAGGLAHRWIIKASLPAGIILLALSGFAALLRQLAALRRRRGGDGAA